MVAYAAARGWGEPVPWHDHADDWLEGFAERLRDAPLGPPYAGDALIVTGLARIFSSCEDGVASIEQLRSRRVALHVLEFDGEVTANRLQGDVLELLRSLADIEKRRSTERIRHIKHRQRSKGRYLGGSRPFGYMIHENGRLIENPVEQRVLRRILRLREQGRSLRAIAREVSTPMAPISFKTVQRVLERHV